MSEIDLAIEVITGGATAGALMWAWRLRLRLAVLETRQETIHSWLHATDQKLDAARGTLAEIVGMLKAQGGAAST